MFGLPWQDVLLALGGVVFFIALIPSITSNDKPARVTSFSTALVLSVFAATYASLSLTFTAGVTALTAAAWWVLFYQKLKRYPVPAGE